MNPREARLEKKWGSQLIGHWLISRLLAITYRTSWSILVSTISDRTSKQIRIFELWISKQRPHTREGEKLIVSVSMCKDLRGCTWLPGPRASTGEATAETEAEGKAHWGRKKHLKTKILYLREVYKPVSENCSLFFFFPMEPLVMVNIVITVWITIVIRISFYLIFT